MVGHAQFQAGRHWSWLELWPVLKGLVDNILNHFEMNSHLVIIYYIILLI